MMLGRLAGLLKLGEDCAMDLFDILTLAGGLSLFLFGMSVMGQALERRAGDQLRSILGRFTWASPR